MSLFLCTQESQSVYCRSTASRVADFEALHMVIPYLPGCPCKKILFYSTSTDFTSITRKLCALLVHTFPSSFGLRSLAFFWYCVHIFLHFSEKEKLISQMKCVGLLSAWQHEYVPSSPKRSHPGEIKSLAAELYATGPQHFSSSNTQHRGLCCIFLILPLKMIQIYY